MKYAVGVGDELRRRVSSAGDGTDPALLGWLAGTGALLWLLTLSPWIGRATQILVSLAYVIVSLSPELASAPFQAAFFPVSPALPLSDTPEIQGWLAVSLGIAYLLALGLLLASTTALPRRLRAPASTP